MKSYINDTEYLSIINPIMENKEFMKMNEMKHHNTTRLEHMLKVSYYSYKVSKKLNLSYKEVARAGLLHDFYLEEIDECNNFKDKFMLFTSEHPKKAVDNAKKIIDLTEKEENIIRTHMFPVDYKIPKYKESWIVSIVDKVLSTGEVYYKFQNKATNLVNLYIILIINMLK